MRATCRSSRLRRDVELVDHDVLRTIVQKAYDFSLGGGNDYAKITVTD